MRTFQFLARRVMIGKMDAIVQSAVSTICLLALALSGCQGSDVNDIPPTADELTLKDAPASSQYTEELWQKFAAALGLKYSPPGLERKSEEDLKEELATFPDIISDSSYQNLNEILVEGFTTSPLTTSTTDASSPSASKPSSPVYRTRCASIERFTKLTDIDASYLDHTTDTFTELAGVSVYKVEYVLHSSTLTTPADLDGDSVGDQIVRSALVTIPDTKPDDPDTPEAAVPLILFGHGGDQGASYKEIAEVFGQNQKNFIIAAPTFPGEPLCEQGYNRFLGTCSGSTIASAAGESQPFDNDADELLGLQDCFSRAVLKAEEDPELNKWGLDAPLASPRASGDSNTAAVPATLRVDDHQNRLGLYMADSEPSQINTRLARQLLRYGDIPGATATDPHISRHPVSHIAGASRGGLAALIALAKAGAALRHPEKWENDVSLSRFQCAALLFPPTTFTMGTFRIALELFMKGQAENSRFFALPAARQLSAFFSEYREGNISQEDMLRKFVVIDGLLNIHLSISALRNWSQSGAMGSDAAASGDILTIHGVDDKVVNSEQSRHYGSFIPTAVHRVRSEAWAPGVRAAVVALRPPVGQGFPTGSQFDDLIYQHGDSVFRASTQISDATEASEDQAGGWQIISRTPYPEYLNAGFMTRSGDQPASIFSNWLLQECGKR